MYPLSVNEIEEIRHGVHGLRFPLAKLVSERLLTIPTHRLLSKKDKEIPESCTKTPSLYK